ncbi:hypothetical protein D3C72_1575440 [compost metagenome]
MWPLELKTNSVCPPKARAERYTPCHGVIWSVTPANTNLSQATFDRSMGSPITASAPGVASRLSERMSSNWQWNPAGSRVVSLFQYRTSNAGGALPSR